MSTIRLARAATGREKLLKFAGAYHGHVDGLLAEAGSGLATAALPSSPGVPAAATANTVIVPWNDPDAVRAALAEHEFAAVLCEPYPANMGLVPPQRGSSSCCAGRDRERRPAGLRRGHLRLPRRARRRPGAHGRPARPHRDGEDHRRRAARRGLRRLGRADGATSRRPATSTRPARCAATRSRPPPRWPRCSCSTTRPTRGSAPPRRRWRRACATRPATRPSRSVTPRACSPSSSQRTP